MAQGIEWATRIGEVVRAERMEREWTQGELARRMGWPRPNVARLEAGRFVPRLESIELAARAFETRTSTLIALAELKVDSNGRLRVAGETV